MFNVLRYIVIAKPNHNTYPISKRIVSTKGTLFKISYDNIVNVPYVPNGTDSVGIFIDGFAYSVPIVSTKSKAYTKGNFVSSVSFSETKLLIESGEGTNRKAKEAEIQPLIFVSEQSNC
jgi:hypothetical protein